LPHDILVCVMPAPPIRAALLISSLWMTIGSGIVAQAVSTAPAISDTQKAPANSQPPSDASRSLKEREVISVHPGSISGNIYTNRFFGFSIEIPEGWKVAENTGLKAFAEKQKQAWAKEDPTLKQFAKGDEVDLPLLALGEVERWKGGPNRRLILIESTDVSEQPKEPSAEEFLKSSARINAEKGLSAKYDGAPEKVILGGRELWKAHSHFTQTTSVVWHETQFVMIDRRHVVQFILMSPDSEGLRTLEPVMKTLHFDAPGQ